MCFILCQSGHNDLTLNLWGDACWTRTVHVVWVTCVWWRFSFDLGNFCMMTQHPCCLGDLCAMTQYLCCLGDLFMMIVFLLSMWLCVGWQRPLLLSRWPVCDNRVFLLSRWPACNDTNCSWCQGAEVVTQTVLAVQVTCAWWHKLFLVSR